MLRSIVSSVLLCLASLAVFAAEKPKVQFMPEDQVKAGMHGVAYTVFEGTTPEPMEVEILGVLRNMAGPKSDVILARLHGEKVEYTGVVAGMSGSPVYVDGKLVGAIAYRIGEFSKEPIAGITPAGTMLEIDEGNQFARGHPGIHVVPAILALAEQSGSSGAEVLAAITGSPYFPGGLAEYVAKKDAYLTFERGPSTDVHLQWASFFDASDEAGQSRLWGSIHIPPDDLVGRRVGHDVGLDAMALARKYFSGTTSATLRE